MPERKKYTAAPRKDCTSTASACTAALAKTCKALKAFSFYPEKHPLRETTLHGAYQAMANLAKKGRVSLIVQRDGFSFADNQDAIDATPMTRALAQELFAREIQQLNWLPELSLSDFTRFLCLLAGEPRKISSAGGLAGMLSSDGIQTITVNQIDISAVFTRKTVGEASEEALTNGTDVEKEPQGDLEKDSAPSPGSLPDPKEELSIDELIALMFRETDDESYCQLARKLLAKGQQVKLAGNFDRLFTILVALTQQNNDPERSAVQRDCARMDLRQLTLGEMTEHLLDHLEDPDFAEKEAVYLILHHLGGEVVDAVIRRFIVVGSKFTRKFLTTALLRIGPPALPALTGLLRDGSWQIVHTAVAILGELGSKDAVKGLALTASHSDHRVQMETIRSLARIGGMEATALLINLLRDDNPAIRMQAISWLGNTKNQRALQPLLQIVLKRDILGKSRLAKKEALLAIGRIGDRRALDSLFKLVQKRHWIVASRWDELKLLAIEAIALIGGESAREFLEKASAPGGRLSRASLTALGTMEQRL